LDLSREDDAAKSYDWSMMISYAGELRLELCARNVAYAKAHELAHVRSLGEPPVIVYTPHEDGKSHGNFHPTSYTAILNRPDWRRRL
jgi:hypothetical protein